MLRRRTLLFRLAAGVWASCRISRRGTGAELNAPVVHRLDFDAANADTVMKLPVGVAVVALSPEDPGSLAAAYRAALAHNGSVYRAGAELHIVGAGPLLDQPDRVEARPLQRNDSAFSLCVTHTQVRLTGAQLRKNVIWRPLVQVRLPEALAPGRYRVDVRWEARQSLPDGPILNTPLVMSVSFEVRS